MKWLEHQRTRYTLHHHPIPFELWEEVIKGGDLFHRLRSVERAHLRELATLFIRRKSFSAVQGFELTTEKVVMIAAQACLPILKLGLDYYDDWVEMVIYPGGFRVTREQRQESGVVDQEVQTLSGEAWLQGPVILAWDEIEADLARPRSGRNVVIHELAHKIDMLNGDANGSPPLHADMSQQRWSRAFGHAFDDLIHALETGHHPAINPYAATDPAEFFAVVSEYFFCDPKTLQRHYPVVYEQLTAFYRHDPMA